MVPITGGARVFTRAIGAINDAGIEVHDIGLRRPTLDDVFLALTGHHAAPEADAEDSTAISEEVQS